MITLDSLFMLSVGQAPLDLQSFDCGRETVTNFFRNEAQAYQDEFKCKSKAGTKKRIQGRRGRFQTCPF